MIRKIIKIDSEKCNGCGACAAACHEGAIQMVDGKAVLTKEDYCDGLGDCLPTCPMNAISFVEREANPHAQATEPRTTETQAHSAEVQNYLNNWPVQLKLLPAQHSFYVGTDLLIAADCTGFAYADIQAMQKDKVTLVGCPKLDGVDYSMKLANIFTNNDIHTVTVLRMQVPCCGGLEMAAKKAILASGKDIPLTVVTITAEGERI